MNVWHCTSLRCQLVISLYPHRLYTVASSSRTIKAYRFIATRPASSYWTHSVSWLPVWWENGDFPPLHRLCLGEQMTCAIFFTQALFPRTHPFLFSAHFSSPHALLFITRTFLHHTHFSSHALLFTCASLHMHFSSHALLFTCTSLHIHFSSHAFLFTTRFSSTLFSSSASSSILVYIFQT